MCTGPETLRSRYGIDAIQLFWHNKFQATGAAATILKVVGRGLDTFRTPVGFAVTMSSWYPVRESWRRACQWCPAGWPYAIFLLSAAGKVFGTKVAFVSVGAGTVNQRMTRFLFNSAARLAYYRSYRDAGRKGIHAKARP